MAKFVLKDVSVVLTVSATPYDLSDHVESVTISTTKDTPETTAMGADWRARLSGLKDWNASLGLHQDFAASDVDAAIYAAFNAASATLVIKPTSDAVSATNPSFSGSVIVPSYQPLNGNVGDVSKMSVDLQGNGVMTRAIS
jgi:predicted secreted protein